MIKKFLLAIVAIFAVFSINAKAIEQDRFFDETFVGATLGSSGMSYTGEWIGMNTGLRIGKWFTPQLGAEIEGQAQFNKFFKTIHSHRVGLNALLNLNYLNGYQGVRHDCEFVPFVGIGWQRNYDYYVNSMYTKIGLQININIDSRWQFNVIPSVGYILSPEMQYDVRKMDYGIAVGATYTFKNSHGTRFFALCNKQYTQSEMNVLNEQINDLRMYNAALVESNATLTKALDDCLNRPKEVVEKVEVSANPIFPAIGFKVGSAEITEASWFNIYQIAEYINSTNDNYIVVGYASEEGTDILNRELSCERAQNVMEALINAGVPRNKIEAVGEGATNQFGDREFNRVVIITIKK